jgi:uncharacterized protein (TIGR02246 family)
VIDGRARMAPASLFVSWQAAFNEHNLRDLSALFTDDALFQSRDPQLLAGTAQICGYYENVPEGTTAKVEVLEGKLLSENILTGFVDVTFTAPTGKTTPLRLSVTAEQIGGNWLIRQYHAAANDSRAQRGSRMTGPSDRSGITAVQDGCRSARQVSSARTVVDIAGEGVMVFDIERWPGGHVHGHRRTRPQALATRRLAAVLLRPSGTAITTAVQRRRVRRKACCEILSARSCCRALYPATVGTFKR